MHGLTGFAPSLTLLESGLRRCLDADATFPAPGVSFNEGRVTLCGLLAEDRISVLDTGEAAGDRPPSIERVLGSAQAI